MSNQLLPANQQYLLSGKASADELRYEHRELDQRIVEAERTKSHTPEEIAEAKRFKLRLRDHMFSRGIDTTPQRRKRRQKVA